MPSWKKVIISGSNAVLNTVSASSFTGSFTGSLFGTASYANNSLSSSYSITSSVATSASYAATASYVINALTASYVVTAQTASYVLNAVSSSFASTASIATSSSYALSASFAPAVNPFPFTGSAVITGSLTVTGSVIVTQNITGSRLFLSSSNGTVSGSTLIVYGSGSAQPVFTVQGSQGELFSITDSLTGSLFSVNDISGLPILEVFSDSTTLIGNYQAPALYTTNKVTSISGSNVIYSLPTASYDGVFVDYTIRSGSNARAGQVFGIWSGSAANYTDNSTTDFGTTVGFIFAVIISGSNMVVTGSSTTAGWTVKTIIRSI
jgi:hypothetical protein